MRLLYGCILVLFVAMQGHTAGLSCFECLDPPCANHTIRECPASSQRCVYHVSSRTNKHGITYCYSTNNVPPVGCGPYEPDENSLYCYCNTSNCAEMYLDRLFCLTSANLSVSNVTSSQLGWQTCLPNSVCLVSQRATQGCLSAQYATSLPRCSSNVTAQDTCWCDDSLCNTVTFTTTEATSTSTPVSSVKAVESLPDSIVIVFAVFLGVVVVLIVSLLCHKQIRKVDKQRRQICTEPEGPQHTPMLLSSFNSEPVQLLRILAEGRFAVVWEGRLAETEVAVKVFASRERRSWSTEREIYLLPGMRHSSLLRCISALDGSEPQLVLELHKRGSLRHYLESHTLSWPDAMQVAVSALEGLAYLHGPAREKPSIAHRDVNSRNILLRDDLSAVISDFGLAIQFDPAVDLAAENCYQVGSVRYMSPELLTGAITFSREAFLQIDIYAAAFTFWELFNRCDLPGDHSTPPFEVALTAELGAHPKDDVFQVAVAKKMIRPQCAKWWPKTVRDTLQQMWDGDADARPTAHCAHARLSRLPRAELPSQDSGMPSSVCSDAGSLA